MQNEFVDMVNKFNENMLQSAKRLGDLNMQTFEKMAAKQAEILSDCFESTTKQVEALSKAKDYKEAMTLQGDLVKGCNDKLMANLKETTDMMSAVRDELSGMFEEAVKYTSESVEKAGELAKKKAA